MSKKNPAIIDCACVIHGNGYDWQYVERLYNMLCRVFPVGIRMHVYTEHDRSVPPHMIKHILSDLGVSGPKRSWWYKIQLFNPEHFAGNMLYLDLDVVIARELDFVRSLPTDYFWAIRDFKYLQKGNPMTINSSMMWFNVERFGWVWKQFNAVDFKTTIKSYPGDQDYISAVIDINQRRFFDTKFFESYRWQCLDGGFDFFKRKHLRSGSGVTIAADTALVVFHGKPKPHEVHDPVIVQLWK